LSISVQLSNTGVLMSIITMRSSLYWAEDILHTFIEFIPMIAFMDEIW